jgi:Ca2+-binding RTX toxin-like protein
MTFYIGKPFSGATAPITLDGNDQYFLAAGITVNVGSGPALFMNGLNNTAEIEGTLLGEWALQMQQGGAAQIAVTGIAAGDNYGVLCFAVTNLVNRGLILSGGRGVAVEPNADATVINYGRIIGNIGIEALNLAGSERGAIDLQNFGTITGHGGTSLLGQSVTDSVINKGQMNGNVNLGGGGDIYDGNGGRVKGWIWGDAGNDTLSGGASADLIYGGVGNDSITGRGSRDDLWGDDTATLAVNAGRDTFDFNAISESGTTSSTRDIIRDFNNGDDRIDLSTIDANTTVGGNQAFTVLTKGTATSAVGTGKIGWYWIDSSNNANDRTIISINNDADAAADMTIELVGLKNLSRSAGVDFLL